MRRFLHLAWEQVFTRADVRLLDLGSNRLPRLLGNLELHRAVRPALYDHGSRQDALPLGNVAHSKIDQSQPRSLLSMARLNSAKSRVFSASCNRIRIAQISFSFSGAFCHISRPLFQATGDGALFRCVFMGFSYSEGNPIMVRKVGAYRPKPVDHACPPNVCLLWDTGQSFVNRPQ